MARPDFEGWATKNDIRCSDGRVIRRDAFRENDGGDVPLVWNHKHDSPDHVLGRAILHNREDGVWFEGYFNDTPNGQKAKQLVKHGDIKGVSIWANQLVENGSNVIHGLIRELSLVLASANPGATITNVMAHGEDGYDYPLDDEAVIFPGFINKSFMAHAEEPMEDDDDEIPDIDYDDDDELLDDGDSELEHADDSGETVEDIINTMNEKQKKVMSYMVGRALEAADEGGNTEMKHNAFDAGTEYNNDALGREDGSFISHSELNDIFTEAKRVGSLRDSFLAHGIEDIDWLFPEARTMNQPPLFIKRPTAWVEKVLGSVHKTPFSRIKSLFADLTEDEARAKGYIKGNYKKEQVFGLLKRTTTPQTIYKKQKLERDDIIDITDINVVSWIKSEMRGMLDEEIARAALIGDGRPSSSDDKINPLNIRPIAFDEDLFNIKVPITVSAGASDADKAKAFITAAIKSRKNYRGSGSPTLYCTEDLLTDMLLLTDANGRDLYDSQDKLKSKLRVSDIVTVPVMEGVTGPNSGTLAGIIVNLNDYNIGADKGGAVNMFEDFDIDYNAEKYLIETRCSGALIVPFSAITLEFTA